GCCTGAFAGPVSDAGISGTMPSTVVRLTGCGKVGAAKVCAAKVRAAKVRSALSSACTIHSDLPAAAVLDCGCAKRGSNEAWGPAAGAAAIDGRELSTTVSCCGALAKGAILKTTA